MRRILGEIVKLKMGVVVLDKLWEQTKGKDGRGKSIGHNEGGGNRKSKGRGEKRRDKERSNRVSWMGGGPQQRLRKERRWEEGRGGTDRGGRVGAVRQVD